MLKIASTVLTTVLFSSGVYAGGIECDTLPTWSKVTDGMVVNQHHIFCGEPKKDMSKAVGFHSMPNQEAPSTFVSSGNPFDKSTEGIYNLRNITLKFGDLEIKKSFSTMFPNSCSMNQINSSIVYAHKQNRGNCDGVYWAQCGPSSPQNDKSNSYCVGLNGKTFTIATAVLPQDPMKINTGFPINE